MCIYIYIEKTQNNLVLSPTYIYIYKKTQTTLVMFPIQENTEEYYCGVSNFRLDRLAWHLVYLKQTKLLF